MRQSLNRIDADNQSTSVRPSLVRRLSLAAIVPRRTPLETVSSSQLPLSSSQSRVRHITRVEQTYITPTLVGQCAHERLNSKTLIILSSKKLKSSADTGMANHGVRQIKLTHLGFRAQRKNSISYRSDSSTCADDSKQSEN